MPDLKPWEMDWGNKKDTNAKPWEMNWDNKPSIAEVPKEEPVTKTESAIRGAAQGASFGFADEITALKESALDNKDYDQALAETRALYKKAQDTNPKTFIAGNLGGGLATSFVPGLNVAGAESLAGAMGRSALSSGLYGAGSSEGDKLDRIKSAVSGAGVGSVTGAAGYGIAQGIAKLAPKMAVKATGATGREQQFKLAPDTGEKLLENGVVKFGDTTEKVAQRSEKMLDEASSNIGKSLKDLDKVGEISKDQVLATLIAERAKAGELKANKAVVGKLDDVINDFAQDSKSTYSFSDLWNEKKGFDKQVNWLKWKTDPEKTQGSYLASKALRDSVEGPANVIAPELADKFKAERQMFSLLKPVKEASERRAAVQNARIPGGVLDMSAIGIGGALGGMHGGKEGGIEGALGGYAISHGIAPRAASSMAIMANSPALRGLVQKGISQGIPYKTKSLWQNMLQEKK